MSEISKLPLSAIQRVVGVSGMGMKKILWHANTINIKQFLNLNEYTELVRSIIECITTPNETLAYELVEFALRFNVIKAYAFIDLPTDIKYLYYVVCGSDLYDTIKNGANKQQIESVEKLINRMCFYG